MPAFEATASVLGNSFSTPGVIDDFQE